MTRSVLTPVTSPIFTSLPASPVDGQVIDYLADATNGIVWRLRYRSGSPSAYKWEFIGGPPLSQEVPGSTSVTATSYTDPGSGPSVLISLSGDYMVNYGFNGYLASGSFAWLQFMSFSIGGITPSDQNGVALGGAPGQAGATQSHASRAVRGNGFTGGNWLVCFYKTTGGTASFGNRWITVTPIRVG